MRWEIPDSPAGELRAAAKRIRSDAAWPTEEFSLSVACWLEATAAAADSDLVTGSGKLPPACRRCSGLVFEDCNCGWEQALAVARAYLGSSCRPPSGRGRVMAPAENGLFRRLDHG